MGQSTEKPVIVEALDLTFRTVEKRTKRYRVLVISFAIVTVISFLLAIFYRHWLFASGLILLAPLVGRFSIADSRSVRKWRADIIQMSHTRNLDLAFFVKTASGLRKMSPGILQDMLATIPAKPIEKNQQVASDPFDAEQKRLEKKAIVGVALLTAAIVSGFAAAVFSSGGLFLLTISCIVLLKLLKR